MKKYFAVLLLLSLLSATTNLLHAQRPRRVGDAQTTQQPQSPPPATQGGRPPVLGGSNYPNNRQPTASPEQKPTGPEEVEAGDIIKVNTTLVTIPVSVMDRDGRYIPNLNKQDFRIWEDGVEQEVAFFASVEKPFSVVLLLDTSPSTQFRLEDIQDAAITFVSQLRPDDKVMVMSFNNDIKVLCDLTYDRNKLERAIRRAHTDDGTRLYDAVDVVLNQQLRRIDGRKAVVLFTDGVDTTSRRATFQTNLLDAEETDALIYPVQYDTSQDVVMNVPSYPGTGQIDVWGQILGGIFGGGNGGGRVYRRGGGGGRGGYPPGTMRSDYELADQYLREMAANTGGRGYRADTLQNMASAFSNVAEELRRQYTIGYYPKQQPQIGQRRQIKVRAKQPNLAVRARDSYIFNPSGTAVNTADPNAPVLRKLSDGDRLWKR
jgi:Ca-activated chloride channel family protein